MPYVESKFLRREDPLKKPIGNIKVWAYSAEALNAISVEKSGYKGMRLLVRSDLVAQSDIDSICIKFGTHTLIPLTKLRYVGYPNVSEGDYRDLLWMATSNETAWHSLNLHMTSRLRYSSHDAEEFAQAAATQVLFHECGALMNSVISRAKRAAEKAIVDTMNGYSGKGEFLTPPPHTTRRAGPHRAVHRAYRTVVG